MSWRGGAGLCVIFSLGCRAPHDVPVDDGREARFVSLSPAITETIGALGASDRLVGRSDWCTLPEAVQRLPSFGSVLSPNLEGLVGVQPATMLVDQSAGADLDVLRAVGPVEALPWLTRADVLGSVGRLGELLDRRQAAERLADALSAGLSETPPPDPDAPRVLAVLGAQGPEAGEIWYVKRNSLHGAALHAAGARNAVDRDVHGAPSMSLESLIALDPPVIVVLSAVPVDVASVREAWSVLTPLTAVQESRVEVISGAFALAPGPSILELVDALRTRLQPSVQP